MKEQIVIASPYKEEHIQLIKNYETRNNLPPTTSQYLNTTRSMMSEIDYKQLEQEKAEVAKILYLLQGETIMSLAHLLGEKDRKVCQVSVDDTTNSKWQEKLLEEVENYAFNILGMEEMVVLQEEGTHIPKTYFIHHEFDDLGVEDGLQIYMKSKDIEKSIIY